MTNISIKNKIADHISRCQSLSDVCKVVKQVKREMENREAFMGISVEAEESVEEINWRQHNYNQRGRGNNRGNYRGNYHQTSYGSRGRGYNNTKHQQINKIDDSTPIDEVENQEEGIYDQDYNKMDDINFPTSDLTKEEDQVYYYDD